DRYAPPHVVVDRNAQIVFASNRLGRYLEMPQGKPSNNVFDQARPGIRTAVRSLVGAIVKDDKRFIRRNVSYEQDDNRPAAVDISVESLDGGNILIVFLDRMAANNEPEEGVELGTPTVADTFAEDMRVRELEDELAETRQNLRTTVEELETSNEELKSTNEEMMSMNEELQSSNEELTTINDELKDKLEQLAIANSDIRNFVESAQIPLVFLDEDMRVRNFTPEATRIFNFVEHDRGRPLQDIRTLLDADEVVAMAQRVGRRRGPLPR
ncbi:MAG: PAS domain-containing protein, partial [Pseudomonadota bacterium]